jgi:flagellar assembly protein FliH
MAKVLKFVDFEPNMKVLVKPAIFADAVDNPPLSESAEREPSNITEDVEAAEILAEAQSHVELMLNQAQMQVNTWQHEAKQAGWEAGYAEGRQVIETELAEALNTARGLARAAIDAKDQLLKDNRREIGQLAVAVAKKIIGKELVLNPKAVADIVAQAIETAKVSGVCCIRVNPQDYGILGPLWDAIPAIEQPGSNWSLVADKRIDRGGCLIEINGGSIDGQLDTQLAQVSAAFEAVE